MVACKLHYYFDRFGLYLDRHPLRYCFDTNNILPANNLSKKMQLSASTAFFKTALIHKNKLRFDEKIKPNFEDAHFVNSYLIDNSQCTVAFLKTAKYYYRRRKVKNSTIDTAWGKREHFDDALYFGSLDLFEKADKTLGYIPKHLQRTILYNLSWYYRYLVNHNEKISFLSDEEQVVFHNILGKLFQYIDIETIEQFNLVRMSFFEKIAWIHLYKKTQLPYRVVYVYKDRKNIYFNYYAYTPGNISIKLNGEEIEIPKISQKEHIFVNRKFILEYSFEIPILRNTDLISIQIDSIDTYIELEGKKLLNELPIKNIKTLTRSYIKNAIYNVGRKLLLG